MTETLLTGPRGEFELPPNLRSFMALTASGVLYVAKSYERDHYFLSLKARLESLKRAFRVEFAPIETIQAMYQDETRYALDGSHTQTHVRRLIKEAVGEGASDVHLEIKVKSAEISFRVNGRLKRVHELSREDGLNIASTLFNSMCEVSGNAYFDTTQAQTSRLKKDYVEAFGLFGARIGTRPAAGGGVLMVLRLLYDSGTQGIGLDTLGYLPEQVAQLRTMAASIEGFRIFAGVTGSGKSMSLKCVLGEQLAKFPDLRVITFEDPPEYRITGAIQTPIQYQFSHSDDPGKTISWAWARAISSAMRLDPDVMMIGEIRDAASAKAAVEAAMTGHGVWTTVHAKDCLMVLDRLHGLGIGEDVLSDASLLTGIINQSLVRTVCPVCALSWTELEPQLPATLLANIERVGDKHAVQGKREGGCDKCGETGIAGRTVVAEIIVPDDEFLSIYLEHGKVQARAYWLNQLKGITKRAHLKHCVLNGQVDPREAVLMGGWDA